MRNSVTAASTSAAIAILTFTAGCSGGSQIAPPTSGAQSAHVMQTSTLRGLPLPLGLPQSTLLGHGSQQPGSPSKQPAFTSIKPDQVPCNSPQAPAKVYVTQTSANSMVAFNQATLTPANTSTFIGLSTPYGVNVRGTRIYVANWGTQNILVYNKCGGAPVAPAIPDSTGVPLGLAFDTAGNLYVSNYYDNGGAQGEVRYYANATGSGVPIGDPLERYVSFVTVNTNGDVFAAGTSGPGSSFHVDWCHNTSTNHCKQGTATWQNTGIPLTNWPGGVRIDSNGNLVVSDQLGNMGVYTVPGFQQLSSLPCPGAGGTLSDCGDFGFNQTGNRLFLADFQYGALYRVNYPSFASAIVDGGMSQVAGAAAWPGPSWGG